MPLLTVLLLARVMLPQSDRPSVDELMSQLQAKYKQGDRKYETLADDIEKEVRKALKSAGEHPYFVLVEQLSKAAQSEISKPDAKRKASREALVAKFPWIPRLELDIGLDGGSDRPVPTQEKGFIELGETPDPIPGFPELSTNQYLFGLQEIVGWRAGVQAGKKLSFEGREPKKPAGAETALPGWEKIRVLLQGTLPEVPLFAVPWLTHSIHARLADRRRSASEAPARMDELLALLDSKWNGFTFETPYSKERLAVVQPVHALITDRSGFFYRFKDSRHMAQVGDLPFISDSTYRQYAQVFLRKRLEGSELIQNTSSAKDAVGSFQTDCAYLSRYKALVDELVRAILCPNLRYPEYLAIADYPKDRMPTEREIDPAFDVSRKHAVLAWAFVGKDPAKLADFLFDEVLDKEANRFPQNVTLSAAFTVLVREKESEMVAAVAARIAEERKQAPGDFEREFSPYAVYMDAEGEPASDFLLASFHLFHERAAKLVQDTACAAVQKALGK